MTDPIAKPKPITARSLVGMSGSAKKRLREAIFCGAQVPSFAIGAVSITAALRIGERLRPCPGCLRCRSCSGCEVLEFEGERCARCGKECPSEPTQCDGSGVLPAAGRQR